MDHKQTDRCTFKNGSIVQALSSIVPVETQKYKAAQKALFGSADIPSPSSVLMSRRRFAVQVSDGDYLGKHV